MKTTEELRRVEVARLLEAPAPQVVGELLEHIKEVQYALPARFKQVLQAAIQVGELDHNADVEYLTQLLEGLLLPDNVEDERDMEAQP
ncbi:MAG: hypothetical protein HRT61_21240 [Ekhidna sp.]|nr:hypothetical protein [Ekhidna sp.]